MPDKGKATDLQIAALIGACFALGVDALTLRHAVAAGVMMAEGTTRETAMDMADADFKALNDRIQAVLNRLDEAENEAPLSRAISNTISRADGIKLIVAAFRATEKGKGGAGG